jgi:hypothetical protein
MSLYSVLTLDVLPVLSCHLNERLAISGSAFVSAAPLDSAEPGIAE